MPLLLLRAAGVTGVAPSSTAPPAIVGAARSGSVLVAQPGSWAGSPAPTFAFQWQGDVAGNGVYSNISGATGATYVVKATDVGRHIRVVVTAINVIGVASANSSATATITVADYFGRKAAYPTEISWGQVTSGLFTFGVSSFGGADLLAAAGWSAGFAGPYDQVTSDVREFQIQRGRDTDLATIRSGSLNLTLRDPNGLYNPENPASPVYGFVDTDKPVRVSGQMPGGAAIPLYYGFITDVQADPSARGHCIITANDFLDKLDRQNPILGTLQAGATDGAIIGAILDWFRWTDPTMRNLAVGDTMPVAYTLADGSNSGLSLISDLLASERGVVYVDKAGAVRYASRQTRYLAPSAATIDRMMTAFPIGRSNSNITNQWTITRTDMAGNPIGTPQVWPDPAAGTTPSQQRHGIIPDTISTAFLLTDSQALNLAQFLVSRTQDGLAYVYDVPINIADTATLAQVFARDLNDRLTMTIQPRNMATFTGDFFIESISHSVTAAGSGRHTCAWRVSKVLQTGLPFRFGVSLMGGSDVLYY